MHTCKTSREKNLNWADFGADFGADIGAEFRTEFGGVFECGFGGLTLRADVGG